MTVRATKTLNLAHEHISFTKRPFSDHRANMKRGVLIGLLALFFLLCTCTAGSAVQQQKENGIMEVEANKKDEELQDAEASEDDATELVELEEQSGAGLERRKKRRGKRSRGGRSRGGGRGWSAVAPRRQCARSSSRRR